MKKLLCICLITGFTIASTSQTQAQYTTSTWSNNTLVNNDARFNLGNNLTWGIEAGLNFANINGSDFNTEALAGFMFGVYLKYLLTTNLILQPELLYVQKGWSEGDINFRLNYIAATVLLNYYFVLQNPSIRPFIKAGPYLGSNTSAKVIFDDDQEQDLNNVNDTDVGLIARAGVGYNRIEGGVRVSQAFTSIFENGNSDAKNFLFGFFVALNFN